LPQIIQVKYFAIKPHMKNEAPRILPKKMRTFTLNVMDNVSSLFINLHISPNALSVCALLAGAAACIFFSLEKLLWGGISIVICGLFDIIDGQVAESTNRKSLFGAMLDSTSDRYSEFFIYLGLAVHFRNHWALWVTLFTILGSSMVSYTRARAEGLGIECRIGIMQRAERMVFLAAGVLSGVLFKIFDPLMIGVLSTIAVVSNITAIQRTLYVRKVEKLMISKKKI
jgi:CDP-diacylglycerol--glycerol-3-phosphate 3-phosphatidyltransferase